MKWTHSTKINVDGCANKYLRNSTFIIFADVIELYCHSRRTVKKTFSLSQTRLFRSICMWNIFDIWNRVTCWKRIQQTTFDYCIIASLSRYPASSINLLLVFSIISYVYLLLSTVRDALLSHLSDVYYGNSFEGIEDPACGIHGASAKATVFGAHFGKLTRIAGSRGKMKWAGTGG